MSTNRKKIYICVGPDSDQSDSSFNKLSEILSTVLRNDLYSTERLYENATDDHKCVEDVLTSIQIPSDVVSGLILSNYAAKLPTIYEPLKNFFLRGGQSAKVLTFCEDLQKNPDTLKLLNIISQDEQSLGNILDLFRLISAGRDVPVDRQFVTLAPNPAAVVDRMDDEFTVAVAKVENSFAYLDVSAESGSELVFVSQSLEKSLQASTAVWTALAQAMDLEIVSVVPQIDEDHQHDDYAWHPPRDSIPVTLQTILICIGRESTDRSAGTYLAKLDQSLKAILEPAHFKYHHTTLEKLSDELSHSNLHKKYSAIVLAAENSAKDVDEKSKRNLLDYFRRGGKVLFLGRTTADENWTWLLDSLVPDKQILGNVKSKFDKFAGGERIPSDWPVQINSDSKSGDAKYEKQNYAVAMLKVDGMIPVLYVSADEAGTVAFAAAHPFDLLDQNVNVWKDLLRVIDVNVLPGQDHKFTYNRMMNRLQNEVIKPMPPNLFIYSDDKSVFKNFAQLFKRVLHRNTYVIYQLESEILKNIRWTPYCKILFVPDAQLDDVVKKKMLDYVKSTADGGRVVYFYADKEKFIADNGPLWLMDGVIDEKEISQDFSDRFRRFVRTNSLPTNLVTRPTADSKDKNIPEYYAALLRIAGASIFYMSRDERRSVAFVVGMPEKFANPDIQDECWRDLLRLFDLDVAANGPISLTSGYLSCKNEVTLIKTCELMKAVTSESTPDMLFVRISSDSGSPTFPIRVKETHTDFDSKQFFHALKTNMLDEIGKVWMSPAGAATFAFNIKIPKNSALGKHIGFAKCLATYGVLKGIKSMAVYTEASKLGLLQLGLKWPDDIYHDKTIKLGGVLCKVDERLADSYVVSYGIGVNVSNQRPTACLNDFVNSDAVFETEDVIASILNEFEKLLEFCQKEGTDAVAKLFNENY
uniref:BPL/LPL catalytic domain-containing protein n=1 Tax=Romanomermis culicivorax TaxID=13658 RepID=A0A915L0S2_ROMCU